MSLKKILIAADIPTHPTNSGNKMCILQNASFLESLGFEVYFLLYCRDEFPNKDIEESKKFWGNRMFIWRETKLENIARKIKGRLVSANYSKLDFYCPRKLITYINGLAMEHRFEGLLVNYVWMSRLAYADIPHKALYTHDVFSNRAERIDSEYKWMSFSPDEESKGLKRFKNILAIQNVEASFFSYLAPASKVIPIYSPVEYIDQPSVGNKNILFFSGGGELNLLGIRWFFDKIFPLIRAKDREVRLLIGGKICNLLSTQPLPQNVKLMGLYENPSDFYINGDVVINPVYSGSGLKIKTLEALAHGKWTITHPHSAEGMYDECHVPLLSTSIPDIFANYVIEGFDNTKKIKCKLECEQYINALNSYIAKEYMEIFDK